MVLIAALAGIVVGLVVGAFGAGGGILAVPTLVYILGHTPHEAAAYSLIIVGLTALVTLIPRRHQVNWRQGLLFAALAIIGSAIGSFASTLVSGQILMVTFGTLLLGVGAFMWRKARKNAPPRPSSSLWLTVLTATIVGLLTGFFGVGGGFMIVPALVTAMGFAMREAAATSLVVMVVMSATGIISRLGADISYDLPVIITFAAASMVATLIGERLTRSVSNRSLTYAFAGFVGVMGAAMIAASI